MVKQLVYRSRSVSEVTPDALNNLLSTARRNNAASSITGLLLYGDGRFIQVLEGGSDDVDQLFMRIQNDQRHYDVEIVYTGYSDARAYRDWQMACRPIWYRAHMPDIFVLAEHVLDRQPRVEPIDVGQLMKTFYKGSIPVPPPSREKMN
ncbi:MAG: BLUF domain-containing protein [Pseudomonadota bacterium]